MATQDLNQNVPQSLVISIRQAATAYRSAPEHSSVDALQMYLAALETLADYVATRCPKRAVVPDIATARQRFRGKLAGTAQPHRPARVIPFIAPRNIEPSPLTAA